jgi:hypothetical protein
MASYGYVRVSSVDQISKAGRISTARRTKSL